MKVHENAEHCRTLWQKTGKKIWERISLKSDLCGFYRVAKERVDLFTFIQNGL
jgi:hypothetical protein